MNKKLILGVSLALVIALVAMYAETWSWVHRLGFSALTMAIVFGMILGNSIYPHIKQPCHEGINFAKQKLLRAGIILFGFKLTFQDIAMVGWAGGSIDILVVSSTFLLAYWLGHKRMGMDKHSAILIGAGSAICGAAAVLATEPVIKAQAEKVTVAVATVVIFGTIAMFLWPVIYSVMSSQGMTEFRYGLLVGSTTHEVAQAVAAGKSVSDLAMNVSVITKMLRVMLLAPFLFAVSLWVTRSSTVDRSQAHQWSSLNIPWFALGFLLTAAFNSLGLLPASWVNILVRVDNLLLAMAMAALGITTHFSAIRQAGTQPIILAGMVFIWLFLGGALINMGVLWAMG